MLKYIVSPQREGRLGLSGIMTETNISNITEQKLKKLNRQETDQIIK